MVELRLLLWADPDNGLPFPVHLHGQLPRQGQSHAGDVLEQAFGNVLEGVDIVV